MTPGHGLSWRHSLHAVGWDVIGCGVGTAVIGFRVGTLVGPPVGATDVGATEGLAVGASDSHGNTPSSAFFRSFVHLRDSGNPLR
jgi:hypothetical protein